MILFRLFQHNEHYRRYVNDRYVFLSIVKTFSSNRKNATFHVRAGPTELECEKELQKKPETLF